MTVKSIMKVVASLRPICKDCFMVRRGKTLYLRCKTQPRHKRRQGFSTLNQDLRCSSCKSQQMSVITQYWMNSNAAVMGTSQQMELLLNMEESNHGDQINLYEKLSIWKSRTKVFMSSDWLVGLDKLNVSGYKFKK